MDTEHKPKRTIHSVTTKIPCFGNPGIKEQVSEDSHKQTRKTPSPDSVQRSKAPTCTYKWVKQQDEHSHIQRGKPQNLAKDIISVDIGHMQHRNKYALKPKPIFASQIVENKVTKGHNMDIQRQHRNTQTVNLDPIYPSQAPCRDDPGVKDKVRMVVGDLEGVLGELRSVVGDLKILVGQIDQVSDSFALK